MRESDAQSVLFLISLYEAGELRTSPEHEDDLLDTINRLSSSVILGLKEIDEYDEYDEYK